MPYNRRYPKYKRKKKTYYKTSKSKPRQIFRPRRGLMRQVVPFMRERETHVRLDTLTGIDDGAGTYLNMIRTNDGGVVGRIRIRMNNLNTPSDFTNLFKEYKLNYLKLIFIPAGNVAGTREDHRDGGPQGNKNILVRVCLNRTGDVPAATDTVADWCQLQAKKQFVLVGNKITKIGCKLNQLVKVQSGDGAANTIHHICAPKYISTNNTSVNHYGLTVRFDAIDGTDIVQTDPIADGDVFPKFRVISKLYFTCRGVA